MVEVLENNLIGENENGTPPALRELRDALNAAWIAALEDRQRAEDRLARLDPDHSAERRTALCKLAGAIRRQIEIQNQYRNTWNRAVRANVRRAVDEAIEREPLTILGMTISRPALAMPARQEFAALIWWIAGAPLVDDLQLIELIAGFELEFSAALEAAAKV